jgi:hypothetical protein
MMKMAPMSENPTAINVVIPKLLMIGKLARQRAEKPKNVARPDTVIAVPIFCSVEMISSRRKTE